MKASDKILHYKYLLSSIILHLIVILPSLPNLFKKKEMENTFVELEYKAPEPPIPKIKLKPKVTVKEQQIVEQEIPQNNSINEKTNFLSSHNQTVEKETRAKKTGEFKNKTDSGYKDLETKDLSSDFALNEGQQNDNASSSSSNDYMKEIEEGVKTVVNTKEFIYYSYYNKIRTAIQKHWKKNVHEQVKIIYRDSRDLAEAAEKVTRIAVLIDKSGNLKDIEIIKNSGNNNLDRAATNAFEEAQPFPPPPEGILENDGNLRIRWDFVLN